MGIGEHSTESGDELTAGNDRDVGRRMKMNHSVQYDARCSLRRWVAYLDLLSIRSLLKKGQQLDVFFALTDAQRQVSREGAQMEDLHVVWFSDTFILYTDDDSKASFVAVHTAAYWFMHWLTLKLVPVRGAMSCGDLYADSNNHVYFGTALVESYEYGEAQDWIGFILSPSAELRLREVGMAPEERLDYVRWPVPFKKRELQGERFACLFAGATESQSRDFCRGQLIEMQRRATTDTSAPREETDRIAAKYAKTLEFLDRNVRFQAK